MDATCTESGIDEHTCSSCKWTEQRISEPTGHIWDEGTVNENGETVYTCRICGATTGELPFVNPFTDVNEDDWFYDSVVWAVKGGITNGISETEFGISSNCNRAQAVTFLYRALAD